MAKVMVALAVPVNGHIAGPTTARRWARAARRCSSVRRGLGLQEKRTKSATKGAGGKDARSSGNGRTV